MVMAMEKASPLVRTITAAHFRTHCLRLFNEVQATRVKYVITKRGKPVAVLNPVDIERGGDGPEERGT